MNINLLLKQEQISNVQIELDPELTTAEQQSLSREKVRNVIEKLSASLPKLQKSEAVQELKGTLAGKKPKKKKKKTPPKSKKKVTTKSSGKVSKKATKAKKSTKAASAPALKKVVRAKKPKT